jgi:hypothetical protein
VSLPTGSRVVATRAEHLAQLASYPGDVEIHLDVEMCRHIPREVPPNWILHAPTRPTAEDSARLDPDWRVFFAGLAPGYRAQNLPACLMPGARIERPLRLLRAELFHDDGRVAIDPFVERYTSDTYRTKSSRCRACPADAVCEGAHIQSIRAHGYRQLRPLEGDAREVVTRLAELVVPGPRLRDGAPAQPSAVRVPVAGNAPVPFIDVAPGRRS